MKQKMLSLATLIMLGSVVSYAQTAITPPKAALYIKGGFNLANVTVTKGGALDANKQLPTFNVGLQGDLPIGSYFAIQPGVFFTGKGSKLSSGDLNGNNWYRATTRPYYIEIPVNAVVKFPVADQTSLFVGAGPYLAIGVGGKNRVEGEAAGVAYSRSEKIKFSNDDPFTSQEEGSGYNIVRRFDYGVNATVGIQAKMALFSVNYGWGFAKVQSGTTSSQDALGKYRTLSLNVGFRL